MHYNSPERNVPATRKTLWLAAQLVDFKKNDGFASLNGHSIMVDVLVPFLLAVAKCHMARIEKLVDLGCDVLVKDEHGGSAMHLCVIKKSNLTQKVTATDAPKIHAIY